MYLLDIRHRPAARYEDLRLLMEAVSAAFARADWDNPGELEMRLAELTTRDRQVVAANPKDGRQLDLPSTPAAGVPREVE